eukprot:2851085-Amphidinium_carterae.2
MHVVCFRSNYLAILWFFSRAVASSQWPHINTTTHMCDEAHFEAMQNEAALCAAASFQAKLLQNKASMQYLDFTNCTLIKLHPSVGARTLGGQGCAFCHIVGNVVLSAIL